MTHHQQTTFMKKEEIESNLENLLFLFFKKCRYGFYDIFIFFRMCLSSSKIHDIQKNRFIIRIRIKTDDVFRCRGHNE